MEDTRKKALFVCLGNICRSPIAEAVFIETIKTAGQTRNWLVDSAAIGSWHVGRTPDKRALETMEKHNLPYKNKARQVQTFDFEKFHYIFGMDPENINDLKRCSPKNCISKILMLGDFDPEGDRIIRDPYYDDGAEGFEKCYEQCVRCCNAFLEKVNAKEL